MRSAKKIKNIQNIQVKLILYISISLVLVFYVLGGLINYSIENNSNNNVKALFSAFAANGVRTLEERIKSLEATLPDYILKDDMSFPNIDSLPMSILESYSFVQSAFIRLERPELQKIFIYKDSSDCFIYRDYDVIKGLFSSKIIRSSNHRNWYLCTSFDENHKVLVYTIPIYDIQKEEIGMIGISIPFSYFVEMSSQFTCMNNGYVFLTDNEKRVVWHPTIKASTSILDVLKDCDVIKRENNTFSKGENGYLIYSYEGERRYVFYTQLSIFKCILFISSPYDDILLPKSNVYIYYCIISPFVIALLVWISLKVINRISKPVVDFLYDVESIKEGKFKCLIRDEPDLKETFEYISQTLSNYQSIKEEHKRLTDSLDVAQRIQQHFLPQHKMLTENVDVYGHLKQSDKIGGDLYEYFISGDRLYFAVGDVSGSGISAALYMASVMKLYRSIALQQVSAAQISAAINTYMYNISLANEGLFITMGIGIIDLKTGVLTYTNAGHTKLLKYSSCDGVSSINLLLDPPIGFSDKSLFKEQYIKLSYGDILFLYSDGVTEAESKNGDMYGMQRLKSSFSERIQDSLEVLVEGVYQDILNFVGEFHQSDDILLFALRYTRDIGESDV